MVMSCSTVFFSLGWAREHIAVVRFYLGKEPRGFRGVRWCKTQPSIASTDECTMVSLNPTGRSRFGNVGRSLRRTSINVRIRKEEGEIDRGLDRGRSDREHRHVRQNVVWQGCGSNVFQNETRANAKYRIYCVGRWKVMFFHVGRRSSLKYRIPVWGYDSEVEICGKHSNSPHHGTRAIMTSSCTGAEQSCRT